MPAFGSINSSSTTAQNLVDNCRDDYLQSTDGQPEVNRLSVGCTDTDTSLTFLNEVGSMAVAGTRICIDYEEIRVWQTSGNQATLVDRGVGSSLAANHSAGALVEVGPKFSQWRVIQAINMELNVLSSSGLFQVGEVNLTYNPAVQGYDLGSIDWDDVIDVRYEIPGPTKNWPLVRKYAKLRNADTSQYPSGNGIILYETAFPGLPVRVRYRGPFNPLVNGTDNVASVTGLPTTAIDIPAIGAAIRLMAGAEIPRGLMRAQRDAMLLQDVPPGTATNSVKNLMVLYQQRVVQEAGRLAREYPRVGPK